MSSSFVHITKVIFHNQKHKSFSGLKKSLKVIFKSHLATGKVVRPPCCSWKEHEYE